MFTLHSCTFYIESTYNNTPPTHTHTKLYKAVYSTREIQNKNN